MAALRGDGFARLRPPRARRRTPRRKDKDTPVSNERASGRAEPRAARAPQRRVPRTHRVKLRAGAGQPATGRAAVTKPRRELYPETVFKMFPSRAAMNVNKTSVSVQYP
ncbi:hypothetical protein NN561_011798 [Cricetulus griseus]